MKDAIDIGYRFIDNAFLYENEAEVGRAVREKIAEGVIKREDIFVSNKLWNNAHNPESVEPALRKTLENLGLDYVDMYLIHWPMAYKGNFKSETYNSCIHDASLRFQCNPKDRKTLYSINMIF